MSDHADSDVEGSTARSRGTELDGAETVEAYETDGGVVLHDAENPLAWVEATRSYRLDELV